VLLSLAVAPAVFLLFFVYLRDKYQHEPLGLVAITFVLGAIGIVPASLVELLLVLFFPAGVWVSVFVEIALVEEVIKFGAVRIKAYHSPHFNEVMDGIVYAVAGGLGFATLENIIYVLEHGLTVAIVRAFLSVPDHAVWAGIMGFFIGLARCRSASKSEEDWQIVEGVGLAVLFHGLFDVSVYYENFLAMVGVSAVGWVLFLWMTRKALSMSPFRWRSTIAPARYGGQQAVIGAPRFCSHCGYELAGDEKFCMNCGAQVVR
jgi:RsiW-degrading membrane proteinase PrsW (M82 family)